MVNVMSFNLQKIRMDITKGNYTSLGSGSGRQVYDLDNGYVVGALPKLITCKCGAGIGCGRAWLGRTSNV
jgi:hypothetical protein